VSKQQLYSLVLAVRRRAVETQPLEDDTANTSKFPEFETFSKDLKRRGIWTTFRLARAK
jgi:hypothetical protein